MKIPVFPLLLLAAITVFAPSATPAEQRRPLTFEDMMKMKRLGDTAVSPDGKWLLYDATDVDLDKNTRTSHLWLQAIHGGEPRALFAWTQGEGGGRFSPDGSEILFTSSRDGGEQIWLASFDTSAGIVGEPHRLTSLSTEADGAIWSPTGRQIVFTSAVYPDCPAAPSPGADACNKNRDDDAANSKVKAKIFTHLLYRHWNAFTGDKHSHLFLINTDGSGLRDLNPGDTHDVPPFSLGGGGAYAISPDGRELAFEENLDAEPAISTNADIFTLDLTNGFARPVRVSTSLGGDFSPAYSSDGKWLAWRSQERPGYESDRFRLVVYNRAKKTIKEPLVNFDRWVDEFAWTSDSKRIYFVDGNSGEAELRVLAIDGMVGDNVSFDGEYSDLHPVGDVLYATRMTVRQPSEVVRLDFDRSKSTQGKVSQITHLNDALLAQLDLASLESFWFPAPDRVGKAKKLLVQGFLIRPPAFDEKKKYPVKFLIHGGPQGAWGDSWSYRWNAELFAANGYVVVMVNPRGSTGYGQAFVDGVNGDWGGKPFLDLMRGLDYAEQHYPFIDKDRECALGASYGGYMANWVEGHTGRFKCIVSHDGMFNPEAAYGSTEELWFNEWEFKGHPWDYYGKPDSKNPFRKWSPALSAKNFHTPMLVVHGQLDYRLDVSQGFDLFTTLQRLGVPSKMLYFPDEGHWVLKPQNSRLWYATVNGWVDEYLKQ
jgi:dipeptidyl aminopeptidase/acylaminoacyl peptidase